MVFKVGGDAVKGKRGGRTNTSEVGMDETGGVGPYVTQMAGDAIAKRPLGLTNVLKVTRSTLNNVNGIAG